MATEVRGWLNELFEGLKGEEDSYTALMTSLRGLYNGPYFSITSRWPFGVNAFSRDWDLLIILDACRVDAITKVASEYDFIDTIDSIWSVGSASHEWICKTYTTEYEEIIRETVLVSANPWVPRTFNQHKYPPGEYSIPVMWANWRVVDAHDFKALIHVHNHEYEEYFKPTPPETMTDHAIYAGRTLDYDRMVVHYFQPHRPYISGGYKERRQLMDVEVEPWEALRNGQASKEEVWELYLDNLRLVLDSAERLLENIDAPKTIISADHGDLFGEMGAFGHPEGFPHPKLKKVPWIGTEATDIGTSTPDVDPTEQDENLDIKRHLRDLGYL